MTRLIDADTFKENIDDICNLSGDLDPITEAVRKFMKNHIDGQTTVEAIPLEWIQEWCESQDLEYVRLGIKKLIDAFNAEKKHAEKVRHGKWIRHAESDCGISCSFCGTPVDDFFYSIDYINLDHEPNYCPNCGAKMDGQEDTGKNL